MQKVTIILTLMIGLSIPSCSSIFNCENGSGNQDRKQIDLSNIKKVELIGSGELIYTSDPKLI